MSDVDAGNGGNGSVTLTYEAGDTSCVAAPLTVTKTAVGAATPGTTFTMHVACENATIAFGVAELSDVDLQFTVDESGTVQPAVGQSIGFYGPNDCTVTETGNGGATSTSYECVGSGASEIDDVSAGSARWDGGVGVATAANPDDPCVTSGPQAEAMEVAIVDPNQEATRDRDERAAGRRRRPPAPLHRLTPPPLACGRSGTHCYPGCSGPTAPGGQ